MCATMQCQWQWTARAMRDTHAARAAATVWEWLRLLRATLPTTVDAITANEYKLAHLLTLYLPTANSNTS